MERQVKVTVFVTSAGFDVLLQRGDEPQTKGRIGYDTMKGSVGAVSVEMKLGQRDDELVALVDGVEAKLRLQPKGHFFGWVGAKPTPIGLAEARRLIEAAKAQTAGRPSRKRGRVELTEEPTANDQIPF